MSFRYNVQLLHRCPHLRAHPPSGTLAHPLKRMGKLDIERLMSVELLIHHQPINPTSHNALSITQATLVLR